MRWEYHVCLKWDVILYAYQSDFQSVKRKGLTNNMVAVITDSQVHKSPRLNRFLLLLNIMDENHRGEYGTSVGWRAFRS